MITSRTRRLAGAVALALLLTGLPSGAQPARQAVGPVTVDLDNFVRAETDRYFGRFVEHGAFGTFLHERSMTAIDRQEVVRMNRDTLYSTAVFDLDAAPVSVTLPDPGRRFMSMQVISEDHYTLEVVYAPGRHTYTRAGAGTRYVVVLVRTFANPDDPEDMKAAHALQDGIQVEQARTGAFEVPAWDQRSQDRVRAALGTLGALGGGGTKFGSKAEVDPVGYLVGAAMGWGGNPASAAIYESVTPPANDGRTVHTLAVKDVPVDGFWSISVYNAKGFFEQNASGAYSLNNVTATPNPDGSYTVQFGGCRPGLVNCLPITPGWNYTVRLYRARPALVNGSWTFPPARPVAPAAR